MSVEQNSLNNENLSFPIEQKVNWTKVIWTFSYSIMKSFEQKDNCPAWKFINSQFISCKLNNSQLNNFLFEQINIKQVQKSIDKCVNWTITNWTVHTIEQKASWYFFCSIDLLSIDIGIGPRDESCQGVRKLLHPSEFMVWINCGLDHCGLDQGVKVVNGWPLRGTLFSVVVWIKTRNVVHLLMFN